MDSEGCLALGKDSEDRREWTWPAHPLVDGSMRDIGSAGILSKNMTIMCVLACLIELYVYVIHTMSKYTEIDLREENIHDCINNYSHDSYYYFH